MMSRQSTVGGIAVAVFLFAAVLFGLAAAVPWWIGVFAEIFPNVFVAIFVVFGLLGCSGFLAILATILGTCSRQSTAGKLAALGGLGVLIGVVASYWGFQ